MLSQKYTRLLTAYLDGELNRQQRKLAVRLLRQSVPARKLFRELKRDSRQLAALPRQTPPADLAEQVVSHIAQQPAPVPAPPATLVPAPVESPNWLGLAIAASVLFLVTLASYLYFASDLAPDTPGLIAEEKQEPPQNLPEPEPPIQVEPPLLQFALGEYQEKKEIREKLTAELKKENAVQMDLATRNNGAAVKNLKKAFEVNRIQLVVDTETEKLIAEGKKVILYVEDLFPEQVAAIMDDLAGQAEAVQTVALNGLSEDKRGEVAKLLGLELEKMQPARKTGKAALPPPPVPEGTIIVDPKKPGKKPEPPKSEITPEYVAVILPYDMDAAAGGTANHVQNFLKARKTDRVDDTLQLVIVLNETPV